MRKQVISIFLVLVLSIQLLPLTQISTAIYQSQQMNEELPHNDNPSCPVFSEEIHKHFVSISNEELMGLTELRIIEVIHRADKVYTRFSDDVQTPPPNC